MDINDLNKSQLILLAILLSFITSIATGITTVTLMDQAPDAVTVPINRVIRQTVEKIQQVEGKTTVQTVVVKEEDLVVDAISKNKSSVFTLTKEVRNEHYDLVEVSAGRGFAVSDKNIIVADSLHVPDGGTYYAENSSGKFRAQFLNAGNSGFSFLKISEPVNGTSTLSYTVPAFGDLSKMKVGQKMIIIGGGLSTIIFEGGDSVRVSPTLSNAGGLILNLEGEALGIALYNDTRPFASIDSIKSAIPQI